MIERTMKCLKHKPGLLGLCFFSALMLFLLCFTSCKKEDPEVEAYISISKTSISISSEGGLETTRIKSDQDWSINVDQDWVQADPMHAKAGEMTTVNLTIARNTNDEERTAILTVKSGASEREITILQKSAAGTIDPASIDVSKIYVPMELQSMDLYSSTSTWYYGRSKQSEHFIVFWGKGYDEYGMVTPTDYPNNNYKVDIDDLLEKAEEFYDMNVNTLKFITPGNSKTDQYKMMIFLLYQTDWLATGAGYDNTIGALWVSPGTCQPVGSTIAHEIGHCFQYQVYCDLGGNSGWRYGFGGNGGNGYWEQCAQWQAYQSYPKEAFSSYNFNEYIDNCHRSTFHEWQRYANYFINYYWADKHGIDFIGKLWQQSGATEQEDPAQAYMRITGITLEQYNNEQFDYASKMVTWDLDALRDNGNAHIGAHNCSMNKVEDDYWQVSADKCPENHGYNAIRLNVPAAGTAITANFEGMPGAPGYNAINVTSAGWRYGYVALLDNGTRIYSDMYSANSGTATFICPENCSNLWFVVSGAPTSYWMHPWDEDATNDEQWPYKVKFDGTNIYGVIEFTPEDLPYDENFVYNISFPADASAYSGTTVTVDVVRLCYAYVLSATEITSNIGLPSSAKKIKFYGVDNNGTLVTTTTANGYGHWFDANGNVCSWVSGTSGTNMVFSEFDENNFVFTIGQHPGRCTAGNTFKIKQAMVYSPATGQYYTVTFEFNITITN
ncbi:MAG: DUF4859 domain-containing protein [Bacteroidales bacterium]|nr:DUF4859 domain-containing protein [Bacteroidales bacterium]